MRHISELTTQPLPASEQPTALNAELTDRHIALLWERMTMIYGHKWTSNFGERDDGTWLKGLSDVSVEQIKHGLEKIRVSEDGWPPSLPEFRTLCLVAHAEQVRPPYRPDRSLPWSKCSKEVAERELSKMKKVVHGKPEDDA